MRKKRISGLLCGLLVLTAVCGGCRQAPSPSEVSLPVADTTTSTSTTTTTADTTTTTTTAKPTTTTTTVRVPDTTGCVGVPTTTTTRTGTRTTTDCFRPWIDFETLEDYREALLTCTTVDRVRKLLTEPPAQGARNFTESRYTMLTEEGYFLVPILPAGYTLEEATFSGYGNSYFSVKMPSGEDMMFSYYHYAYEAYDYPPDAYDEITESTIKNSRGLTIHKKHEVSHYLSGEVGVSDLYTWTEGGYPFSVSCHYDEGETPEHEEFVKQLTFERVNIK